MAGQKISLADLQAQYRAQSTPTTDPASSAPASTQNGTANADLVYSTSTGRISAPSPAATVFSAASDGIVRLKRERKGRNGKAVICIYGLAGTEAELQQIASQLKKKCSCGGSVKDGVIEIQGDQREVISQELSKMGYTLKWAGG